MFEVVTSEPTDEVANHDIFSSSTSKIYRHLSRASSNV